jgi:hypothetical protein
MINRARRDAHDRGVVWHAHTLRALPWVPLDLPEVQEDSSWLRHLLGQHATHVYFDLAASEYPLRHGVEVTVYSRNPDTVQAFVQATSSWEKSA